MEAKKERKFRIPFLGFYHYGVILTYLSVLAAIVGIYFSVGGNHEPQPLVGVICLIISGICDSFDGTVARTRKNRTKEDKMFGERIDSLSDLIAFGVAPTAIGFGMKINRWFFFPVFALYVLCALIRLAYFDVTEEIRMQDENCGKRKFYEGLPVTNSAFIIPIFYIIATMFPVESLGATITMVIAYVGVSIAFISKFKIPKPGTKNIIKIMLIAALLFTALVVLKLAVFN